MPLLPRPCAQANPSPQSLAKPRRPRVTWSDWNPADWVRHAQDSPSRVAVSNDPALVLPLVPTPALALEQCTAVWGPRLSMACPNNTAAAVCRWTQEMFPSHTLMAFASHRTILTGETIQFHLAATLTQSVLAQCKLELEYPREHATSGGATSKLSFSAVVQPWMQHSCTASHGCAWPVSAEVTIPTPAASGIWVLQCGAWPGTESRLQVAVSSSLGGMQNTNTGS